MDGKQSHGTPITYGWRPFEKGEDEPRTLMLVDQGGVTRVYTGTHHEDPPRKLDRIFPKVSSSTTVQIFTGVHTTVGVVG